MASLRSLSCSFLIAALALAGCDDNKVTQPSADSPSQAASAKTAAATPEKTAEPQAQAQTDKTAAPGSDSADPEAPDGKTAANDNGNNKAVGNTATAPTGATDPAPTAEANSDDPAPEGTAVASASAAPVEPAGKAFGKKKVESMYAAWLQSGGRFAVGKPGTVQAVVVAKGEYKVNESYPYKFKVSGSPAGVSFPAPISRAVTKSKSRAVVSVPLTPTSAGRKTISGTYYFSVCNDSTCKIAKTPVSVTIDVHDE